MKLYSFAKLNLILKIVGKTNNNYHLLEMFNVLINLKDEIEINESNQTSITYDKYSIDKEQDTIYKIVDAFLKKYNLPSQSIYIIKNIPVAAGLGGISSDAATILKYLNEKYQLKLSTQNLVEFVLPFGTDICYLLYNHKAIVKGIGEIVEPLEYNIDKQVLIINPNISVETKYIYNKVEKLSPSKLTKEYIYNNELDQILENDLEEVVFKHFPNVKKIYSDLQQYLKNVHMSGSGSTLYCLIDKNEQDVVEKLKEKYPDYLIGLYDIL